MIPRYARPEMTAIWEPSHKFSIWYQIEALATEAMAEHGIVPKEAAIAVRKKGLDTYTPKRVQAIDEIEASVRHDVIAFLTELADHVGPMSRYIHQGMTSSDVLDTCLSVQLQNSVDLLLRGTDVVLARLETLANTHKTLATIGRSHGIHAEPTSLGLKFARYFAEFTRAKARLTWAREEISVCAISGAVGTFAHLPPEIEEYVASHLGLRCEPVSSQIIPRDRHAMLFSVLAVVASSVENIATEIRHLHRSEVNEIHESFGKNQKGSSAMPHKRNPILTENLCGLARLVRGYAIPAWENVATWHERDISHSSVERMACPDAMIVLDFALHRLAGVLENLEVRPDAIQKNLEHQHGLYHSQSILLALTQAGVLREDAYRMVQSVALCVLDNGQDFVDALLQNKDIVASLGKDHILDIASPNKHLRHVDTIFSRVFGTNEGTETPKNIKE